jgi:hypothetical protein
MRSSSAASLLTRRRLGTNSPNGSGRLTMGSRRCGLGSSRFSRFREARDKAPYPLLEGISSGVAERCQGKRPGDYLRPFCLLGFSPLTPMPIIPNQRSVVVAVIVTAVVFATLLLLVVLSTGPGPSAPVYSIVIGNESYSFETVTVFGPHWSNFSYRGVTFEFEVWCNVPSPAGAMLCGNVTEANGSAYPFSFWEPGGPLPTQPRPWVTWISPDALEGVQYEPDSGGLAHLLVAV